MYKKKTLNYQPTPNPVSTDQQLEGQLRIAYLSNRLPHNLRLLELVSRNTIVVFRELVALHIPEEVFVVSDDLYHPTLLVNQTLQLKWDK